METIRSISYDQTELINKIFDLHLPSRYIEADLTYNIGAIHNDFKIPMVRGDLQIQSSDKQVPERRMNLNADCQQLPFQNGTFNSIMIDGPFGIGCGPSMKKPKKGSNIIIKRFGAFRTGEVLFNFYKNTMKECARVLKKKGVLILKIQPVVGSGKQWMTHAFCMFIGQTFGLYPKDEMILLAKQRLESSKVKNQQHARKYQAYFYVYVKQKIPRQTNFMNYLPELINE
jgi:hypothetical protein